MIFLNRGFRHIIKFFLLAGNLLIAVSAFSQTYGKSFRDSDSIRIYLNSDYIIHTPDSVYSFPKDTLIVLPPLTKYKVVLKGKRDETLRKVLTFDKDSSSFWGSLLAMGERSVFAQDSTIRLTKSGAFTDNIEDLKELTGKKIKTIRFKSVDLIEGSVIDTTKTSRTKGVKYINKVHRDTRKNILKNQLLVSEGDTLNPSIIGDSERILRELPYIHNARILVVPDRSDTSAVELIVITQDIFPWGVKGGGASLQSFHGELYTRNVDGLGLEAGISIYHDTNHPEMLWGYGGHLYYPGFGNTFIKGKIDYVNKWEMENLWAEVIRDFISPVIEDAGGAYINYADIKDLDFLKGYGIVLDSLYKSFETDLWYAHSIALKETKYRQNLRMGIRGYNLNFIERPEVDEYTNQSYYNRKMILSNLSLVGSKYFRSSMIFGMGKIEDVQVGHMVEVIAGVEKNDYYTRPYGGVRSVIANVWNPVGYFAFRAEFGTFMRDGNAEDGVLAFSFNYFSELYDFGWAKNRNFLKVTYARSIERQESRYIFFSNKKDVHLYSADSLWGDEKIVVNIENVLFLNWNIWGFRFAPFTYLDFTYLHPEPYLPVVNNKIVGFGIGMKIKNESLVFKPLVLRIGYVPKTETGESHFAIDLKFELQTFTVPYFSGKPELIRYR